LVESHKLEANFFDSNHKVSAYVLTFEVIAELEEWDHCVLIGQYELRKKNS